MAARKTVIVGVGQVRNGPGDAEYEPIEPARLMAMPNKSANTMICNILPCAIAATGLVGKMPTSVSLTLGGSLGTKVVGGSSVVAPSPGATISATVSANVTASAARIGRVGGTRRKSRRRH